MSINSYNQTWNKLKTPSLTGGDSIDHQSLFGAGDYTHDYVDSLILGITKSYASTFPAGITLSNTVALKFEDAAAAADAQIVETAGNVLAITTGSSGMTISGNITNINASGCGIGGVGTGFYMDTVNVAARVPNAAGNFYVQSASGAANYVRIGQGVNGISLDTGNLKVVGATNYIGFTNDNGNTGGLVWGYEHSAYYSRIMDDGNLHILTDNWLYFGDINTATGAEGTIRAAFDIENGNFGFGTTDPDGLEVDSEVHETAQGRDNVRMGILYSVAEPGSPGRPRIILEEGRTASIWEIDNSDGSFRIFRPGLACLTIDTNNNVHINSSSYFYIEKTDASDQTPLHINTSTQRVTRATSSRRYKKNIIDYHFDLDKIDLLKAKTFNFKSDNNKGISYIAEDVAEVYPEMAIHDGEGRIENYSDKKMETLLAEEIKDLRKRIKILETKLLDRG